MTDGFVQTDGGLDLSLQLCMEENVIVPERLLDHQQVEIVELSQMSKVREAVRGIRVTTKDDPGPALADFFEYINVPAGFYLDLDSLISGGMLGFDLFKQLLVRVLDSDRYSAHDFSQLSSQQLPKRLVLLLGFGLP